MNTSENVINIQTRKPLPIQDINVLNSKGGHNLSQDMNAENVFDALFGNVNLAPKQKRTAIRRYISAIRKGRKKEAQEIVVAQMLAVQKNVLVSITRAEKRTDKYKKQKIERKLIKDMMVKSYFIPLSKATETHEGYLIIAGLPSQKFYQSVEWRKLRLAAFRLHGRRCRMCGSTPEDGIRLHVDHIVPRYAQPELALNITNLRVLCEDCHVGRTFDDL